MDIRRPKAQLECCPSVLPKETFVTGSHERTHVLRKLVSIDDEKAKETRHEEHHEEEQHNGSSLSEINPAAETTPGKSMNKVQRRRRGPLFSSVEDENIKLGIKKYGFCWAKMLHDPDMDFNQCRVANTLRKRAEHLKLI